MALNFCLALRPPLLKVTPELLMILQEALGIAETDEQVRMWRGKHLRFFIPRVSHSRGVK